jgi:hypothetical protein
VFTWCVSVCGQVGHKLVVCQNASLWQAVHSSTDFHKNKFIVDEVEERILVDDLLWNGVDGYVHVLFLSKVAKCARVLI